MATLQNKKGKMCMQLICQVSDGKSQLQRFYIYQYHKGKWQFDAFFSIRSQQELYEYLMMLKEPIDYAILELNGCYRNTFYVCFPNILIMIAPSAIWKYCERYEESIYVETYREVAIGIEENRLDLLGHEPIILFLSYFYRMKNKEEALAYYERWQLEHTIIDDLSKHFIRTMEYFKDEVLNYFVLKEVVY